MIQRCDGAGCEGEIRALFQRNGWSHFDRCYPYLRAAGGTSWVAREDAGPVYGHVGVLPRTYRGPAGSTRGVVITDLLVDPAHRDFFSAVRLLSRAMEDLQSEGSCAFAYSDPLPGARKVMEAAGFAPFGVLDRYVLPLFPPYLALFRLMGGVARLSLREAHQAEPPEGAVALLDLPPLRYVRADRSAAEYRTRVEGEGLWLECRDTSGPVAVAFAARAVEGDTLTLRDVRWDERRTTVAAVVAVVARWARAQGHRKVSLSTLVPSRMAGSLVRAGCFRRRDGLTLYARGLAGVPPAVDGWLVTGFDSSGW